MKNLNLSKVRLYLTGSVLTFLLLFLSFNQSAYSQDTTSSSVTITTVDSTNDDGTDPHWDVSFEVDTAGTNNNANGGWVVQKVTMSLKVDPCPGTEGDSIDTTVVYFEVWAVPAGDNAPAAEFPNGASDRWAPNPATTGGETYGTFSVSSEITFVSNPGGGNPATPGHPGGSDANRDEDGGSNWGNSPDTGGVPEAGGLISTYDDPTPSFWDGVDPANISSRSWSYSWNNCEDEEVEDPVVIEDGDPEGDGERSAQFQNDRSSDAMQFYPNPVYGQLTIVGADFIETTIYSVSGEVLIKSNERQIDTRSLAPGSYILLMNNGETVQKELLIVR